MKNFKKKWLLPILAIALAVGGAFATNVKEAEVGPIYGYVWNHAPCDTRVTCGDSGVPGCTVPLGIAYGMEDNCTRPLFKP
jgi:hypothetical protein